MRVRFIVGAVAVLSSLVVVPVTAQTTVLVVDSAGDERDPAHGDGVCGTPCTLRAAIEEANALEGTQEIHFTTAGPIRPVSSELQITGPVVIDGTAHPDYAGTPVVELDGSALTTTAAGLRVTGRAAGTTIRGLAIHSFTNEGIILVHDGREPPGTSRIEDNYIGTDTSGTRALPNGLAGLLVAGRDGGQAGVVSGNLVSGNAGPGIWVQGDGQGLRVEDNRIGTDAAGAQAMGNGEPGVYLSAVGVVVTGNLVSGNGGDGGRDLDAGVLISVAPGTPNVVQGNRIGTDATGAAPLPNGADGVRDRSGGNLIGGTEPGQGNIIAFNGGNGVCVLSAQGVQVSGNAIFGNDLLGIDLNEGSGGCTGTVAPNDPGDEPSAGRGNALQNYPVLQGAGGTLDSRPSTSYRIEFFSNDACDASGNGEGQRFVAATDVTTDASGSASFPLPPADGVITATATDPDGNTSEFSACAGGGDSPPGETERVGAAASSDVRDIAIGISQFLFADVPNGAGAQAQQAGATARAVVLARDDDFADELAGAPLAGDDAPILYTTGGPDAPLDPQTRAEIDRVLAAGGKVTILGGARAVSNTVEAELSSAGYVVERLSGASRFETVATITRQVLADNPKTEVMLAFGGNFPDAVTGGAYGARTRTPILLTPTDDLHPSAREVLAEFGIDKTFVLGGTGVISDATASQAPGAQRIAGPNRMATAAEVARVLWADDGKGAAVVVNLERPDAWAVSLSSAVLSAQVAGPQVGVGVSRLPAESAAFLDTLDEGAKGFIMGTTDFVDDTVADQVAARL